MIRTEVEIDYNGLPKRWEYVDCIPSKTVSGGVDLIADHQVLRIVFSTAQAGLLAEERAIVKLLEPRRLLSRDISPAQRARLITEGFGREEKISYNIWTDVQKDKVTLVPREVQLSIWLPPVEEVSDLAERWLEREPKGGEKFSIGHAMSSFKSYLIEAGFEGGRFGGKNRSNDIRGEEAGIEKVRYSAKNRANDIRGRFLNKYHWFEWCEIPEHLFSVRGLVEFEGGAVVGVSDVKWLPLYQIHRDRLVENKVAFKTLSLPTHEWFCDHDSKAKATLEKQLSSEKQLAPVYEQQKAIFDYLRKQIRQQSASKGGLVKGVGEKLKSLAKELADNGPPEMREPNRRCLFTVPDVFLMKLLLERILGFDRGVEYFLKKINSKEVTGQTINRWTALLEKHPLVISAIIPIQQQLAEADCEAEGGW